MRLDKFLSEMQIATRSEAKKLLKTGRITVNGNPVKDGAYQCDPGQDLVELDHKQISYQKYQYFMLYKPAGCVTATEDARDKTVMDYLPKERHRNMSPVGRLDKDTEGLLLITDDGELNHQLLSPRHHVEKCYYVETDKPLEASLIPIFETGMDIGEKHPTAPARLEIAGEYAAYLTITEGKFHQVKRMFGVQGKNVTYLKRISMGSLVLDPSLKPGECRELTEAELLELKGQKEEC